MKTTDKQKTGLVRKYHTLCTKMGISDELRREMLLENYGVESSKELYVEELEHICNVLDSEANKKEMKHEAARKRVFGAIGGWLDMLYGRVPKSDRTKYRERIDKIKAIACRQTECDNFNKIPLERLNNVSHLFSKKQKDLRNGELIAEEEMLKLSHLN